MSEGTIAVERDGHVARLVIDNPARRNAVGFSMWREMGAALESLGADEAVRVVVVTGRGDAAFCAGNDISEFDEWRADAARRAEYGRASARAADALRDVEKPTIARIRGVCVGGGMELAQLCDLQIAADDARFGVTPARLGIGYSLEDTERLTERIGLRFVRELLYTGRIFDAADALRMGLVNRVVPVDALDATVDACAREIAANAPLSLRAVKIVTAEARRAPADRDVERCRAAVAACEDSADAVEGRRAFAEKRPPVFRGE